MLKPGDVLDLGPLRTKFYIKKTAAETDGQSFEMEWDLGPNTGGTPVHIHPSAVETYEVLEGELDVYVDGVWRTLESGETLTVERGVPHTFRNASDRLTRVYNTHAPAMEFANYFEGLDKLANSGVISSSRMTAKAILALSAHMSNHTDEIKTVRPPYVVMRALGFLGRLLGYGVQ